MKYAETKDEITITIDKHSTDDFEGFKGLVQLGLHCNACVYTLCDDILNATNKAADPKERVANHWDDMFIKFTGACMDQMVTNSSELAGLISKFYSQIGEAMGPVSYAGFELRRYFKENEPDNVAYQDWVDDCIYYYEQSEFLK